MDSAISVSRRMVKSGIGFGEVREKSYPTIAAAISRLEAEIAALGTLHGLRGSPFRLQPPHPTAVESARAVPAGCRRGADRLRRLRIGWPHRVER